MKRRKWIKAKYYDGSIRIFKVKNLEEWKGYTTKDGINVYRRFYLIERIYKYLKEFLK